MKRQVLFLRSLVNRLLPVLLLTTCALSVQAQGETRAIDIIKNKVPKHLPIKVEVLYDGDHETMEDGKIKVTNKGTRDIYFVDFILSTNDPGFAVQYSVSWLRFGRPELRDFNNLPGPDDPSIKPGESISIEFGKERVDLFRKARRKNQGFVPDKYELIFQVLAFDDGTGFSGTNGAPFPPKKDARFQDATDRQISFFFDPPTNSCTLSKPLFDFNRLIASLKPVSFWDEPIAISSGTSSCPYPCGTQNGSACYKARSSTTGCCGYPHQNYSIPSVEFPAGCNDPGYGCYQLRDQFFDCDPDTGAGCWSTVLGEGCDATSGCQDRDGDGRYAYDAQTCPGGDDCNDDPNNSGAQQHPGLSENTEQACHDILNLDEDCSGSSNCDDPNCSAVCDPCDWDGDGFQSLSCGGNDCDDRYGLAFPGYGQPPHGTSGEASGSGSCQDGHDNDCDGPKDGADSDCAPTPTPSPEPTPPPPPTPPGGGEGGDDGCPCGDCTYGCGCECGDCINGCEPTCEWVTVDGQCYGGIDEYYVYDPYTNSYIYYPGEPGYCDPPQEIYVCW